MAFEIVQVPRDDQGVRAYVERYKEFRLLSLKLAPMFFGSTLERELAFTDKIWYDRLASPQAATFLAIQGERVVGSLTAVGPLPFGPDEPSPSNPWTSLDGKLPADFKVSHYRINGMFTLPEVRRQGLAKALMDKVIKFGIEESAINGREFTASIIVDGDNVAARTLYEESGFVGIREEPYETTRTSLYMKYSPTLEEK